MTRSIVTPSVWPLPQPPPQPPPQPLLSPGASLDKSQGFVAMIEAQKWVDNTVAQVAVTESNNRKAVLMEGAKVVMGMQKDAAESKQRNDTLYRQVYNVDPPVAPSPVVTRASLEAPIPAAASAQQDFITMTQSQNAKDAEVARAIIAQQNNRAKIMDKDAETSKNLEKVNEKRNAEQTKLVYREVYGLAPEQAPAPAAVATGASLGASDPSAPKMKANTGRDKKRRLSESEMEIETSPFKAFNLTGRHTNYIDRYP